MISKLFRLDGQRRGKHDVDHTELRVLQRLNETHNISSVAVPKYRVRGSFVEYVIECSERNVTWHVFRRYQQFKALDQKLKQLCPMSSHHHCDYGVLPVLASSHWTEVTNQSVDLVEKRRRYLEIYLEQLLVPTNLFYVAKTALYDFLHKGEVPVRYKCTVMKPLVGFSTPEEREREQQHSGGTGRTSPAEDGRSQSRMTRGNGGNSDGHMGGKNEGKGDSGDDGALILAGQSGILERDLLASEDSSFAAASNANENAESRSNISSSSSSSSITEDVPSREDTDPDDVRMPPHSLLCLQCNAEFSSVLFPHRCFSCKKLFCRNCLYRTDLGGGEVAKACMQCHENHKRHQREKYTGKDSHLSSPFMQNKGAGGAPEPLRLLDEASAVRTDVSLFDFELVTTLGRGTFGKVIKVVFRENGKVYAMKVLNKCIIHKRRAIEYIKEEKNIMTVLPPHPYVVTCHFAFQTDYHLFFVLDYLPGGELYSLVYPKSRLSPSDVRFYIAELVLALEHLHRCDIVHRDVKLENIVLGADGHLKLTDFGLARMNFSRHRRCSFVGSTEYVAPETIHGDWQTKALDWWSVGVMLYEMLMGETPFHAANNNDVYNKVLNHQLDLTAPCFTPEAASLIQQLLQRQPRLRLCDPNSIKAHPYFASINWASLENKTLPAPVRIILGGNDTRYFKREFTAEWAVIPKPLDVSRNTLDVLTRRFSNFAYAGGSETSTQTLERQQPQPLVSEYASVLLNPQHLLGIWRVVKVEMTTADGRVSYPWGSEVCGLLAYLPDDVFTMQLTMANRHHLRHGSAERATREELVELCNSYTASFGRYQVKAGTNIILHHSTGSLCPNLARGSQKYFIELQEEKVDGGAAVLKLSTAPHILREENLSARTVLTWERMSSC